MAVCSLSERPRPGSTNTPEPAVGSPLVEDGKRVRVVRAGNACSKMWNPDMNDLLLAIARCPGFEMCLHSPHPDLPCSKIVLSQPFTEVDQYQLPEPWSGHLKRAPILFLGSNPAIGRTEKYPRWDWPNDRIADFYANRFGGGGRPWTRQGRCLLQDGTHKRQWVRYWAAIRKRAGELLGRPAEPGLDYATSEVVHCKSLKEQGVREALEECTGRYLRPLLHLAAAKVVVCLGAVAAAAIRREFKVDGDDGLHGPVRVGDIERYFAFLPHPNARESRTFSKCLPEEQLLGLREWLRTS